MDPYTHDIIENFLTYLFCFMMFVIFYNVKNSAVFNLNFWIPNLDQDRPDETNARHGAFIPS